MKYLYLLCLLLVFTLVSCQPIQPVSISAATESQPTTEPTDDTTILYQTGFEAPNFTPGNLNGQSKWVQRVGKVGGASIADGSPATGEQALHNDGSLMAPVPSVPWSGVLTLYNLGYDVIKQGTPVLLIEADVRLDGPDTVADEVSANLVAMGVDADGPAGLAFNQLSSSGKVLTVANGSAPVTLGEYHRLGLRLDFTQQTAEYFLDGVSFGVEPFRDTQSAKGLMGVRLDLVGEPEVGAQYTASYDNLVVRVVAP
jgi:hypothetical protein